MFSNPRSYSPRQAAQNRSRIPNKINNTESTISSSSTSTIIRQRPQTPLTPVDVTLNGSKLSFDGNRSQSTMPRVRSHSSDAPFQRVANLGSPIRVHPHMTSRLPRDPSELPRYASNVSRPSTPSSAKHHSMSDDQVLDHHYADTNADALNDAHLVRLTPIGKTYVSYFVREKPFIKYLAEAKLSSKEEQHLRQRAARADELEKELAELKRVLVDHSDELEELKKSFAEHDQKLSDTKVKHHLSMWNMAVKGAKQTQESELKTCPRKDVDDIVVGGESQGESPGEVEETSHKYQAVCRDNISLRLRLLAVKALKMSQNGKESASKSFLTHAFNKDATVTLKELKEAQQDLDSLDKDMARLNVNSSDTTSLKVHSSVIDIKDKDGRDKTVSQSETPQSNREKDLENVLRSAMTQIQKLNSRLALSEAKHISVTHNSRGSMSREEAEEMEELKREVKFMKGEKDLLKKKLKMSTVKEANGAISMMKNALTPKSAAKQKANLENTEWKLTESSNEGAKSSTTSTASTASTAVALKRKIVLMPMFFRLPAKGEGKKKEFIPAYRRSVSNDNDDDDDYEEVDEVVRHRKSISLAQAHKDNWKRWQLFDDSGREEDDVDSDDDMDNEGGVSKTLSKKGSKGTMRPRSSSRSKNNLINAVNVTNKLKRLQTKRRDTLSSPIEVSPLAKYLHWHAKDKRVCWDHRRTVRMAYDILRKKAVQEVIDEREGKPKTAIAVFFEDYFFRTFGHLAKYSLRCFVHSLLFHKNEGDPRSEMFALIVGLHHPELYSLDLSVMFMRILRGLFPDHSAIKNLLDKYDPTTKSSNCFVTRDDMWNAILGEGGIKSKQSTWRADELVRLTSVKEFRRDVIKRANNLPVLGNDSKQLTDIDHVFKLMIEFYVEGAMRMQLRLKNFFVDVMAGGLTATAVMHAAGSGQGGRQQTREAEDPHMPAHSTAHMHVTWEDFMGFAKLCESHEEIAREPISESELMSIFSKFHSVNIEDIVDEEFMNNHGTPKRTNSGNFKENKSTRTTRSFSNDSYNSDNRSVRFSDDNEWDDAVAEGGLVEVKSDVVLENELTSIKINKWSRLKEGGLDASVKVENHDKVRLDIKMNEEAKLLSAICYQKGLYLPFEAGTHVDEDVINKSVQLWTHHKLT